MLIQLNDIEIAKNYLTEKELLMLNNLVSGYFDFGKISHKKAIEKAKTEYKKYQIKELSPIEKEYLNSISKITEIAKQLSKN